MINEDVAAKALSPEHVTPVSSPSLADHEMPSRSSDSEDEEDGSSQATDFQMNDYYTLDGPSPILEKTTLGASEATRREERRNFDYSGDLKRIFTERCLTEGDVLMPDPADGVMESWYIARIPNHLFE